MVGENSEGEAELIRHMRQPTLASFTRAIATSLKASMATYKLSWFRYFVRFDPAPTLKKVRIPVLALNGELDLQVAWKENLDLIHGSLTGKDHRAEARCE